jgi:predicted MFS family arabinose efflux permease
MLAGAASLAASMYINHWYWPTICFVTGVVCLVAGLVVLLKRRDYRVTDRRVGQRQDR